MMNREITVQSPGRINLIGEHIDYYGGFVLPAAIDLNTRMHVRQNPSSGIANLYAHDLDENYSFDINDFNPVDFGWPNYLLGIVSEFQKRGVKLSGFDAAFSSQIPMGAGMSSSAALECSFAFALNEIFDAGFDRVTLAEICQKAEHNFVGTKCGIMDQFASIMGKKDHVIYLDCASLECELHPLILDEYRLLLLNSNVAHQLANSEYNQRQKETLNALTAIKSRIPEVVSFRTLHMDQLESVMNFLSPIEFNRCRHVVSEMKRVVLAFEAIKSNDLKRLGKLINDSHESLNTDYEVCCPETNFLYEFALSRPSILGARQMGGGFGGCTLNLIHADDVDRFIHDAKLAYQDAFDIDITPFVVGLGEGTSEI